ncbi:hypothetical protein BD770DRAFT_439638 [Pilaira anomala]|nr:hypothetical protein BD770DRAFT_439638 [Pilaira anomala]
MALSLLISAFYICADQTGPISLFFGYSPRRPTTTAATTTATPKLSSSPNPPIFQAITPFSKPCYPVWIHLIIHIIGGQLLHSLLLK